MKKTKDVIDAEETVSFDKVEDKLTPIVEEPKLPVVAKKGEIIAPDYIAQCNTCFLLENCPLYKKDSTCQLKIKVDLGTKETVTDFLTKIMNICGERILRQYYVEMNSGGVVTKELSNELKQFIGMLESIKGLSDNRDTLKIEAKGTGILTELFGKFSKEGGKK